MDENLDLFAFDMQLDEGEAARAGTFETRHYCLCLNNETDASYASFVGLKSGSATNAIQPHVYEGSNQSDEPLNSIIQRRVFPCFTALSEPDDPDELQPNQGPSLLHHHLSTVPKLDISQATDDSNFVFESGARVLEPQATRLPSHATNNSVAQGDRYVCLYEQCPSKRTFGRIAELERHYRKHFPEKTYECTASGCRYRGTKAFYRLDKFKDHVKDNHDADTLFTCPVPQCSVEDLKGFYLALHIRGHELFIRHYQSYEAEFAALSQLTSATWFQAQIPETNAALQNFMRLHSYRFYRPDHYWSIGGYEACPICLYRPMLQETDADRHSYMAKLRYAKMSPSSTLTPEQLIAKQRPVEILRRDLLAHIMQDHTNRDELWAHAEILAGLFYEYDVLSIF
ncbi:MAG: hypothetical protein M1812_004177 [Candelaria pacifica]|nr:MAG: hypothetical protein M1812_004177 [Candelaria pacifica]